LDELRCRVFDDLAGLSAAAASFVVAAASTAIAARGRFLIALAGGETPRGLYQQLRSTPCDWPNWHIFFGDERCVPADDPARNDRMVRNTWLDHVPVAARHVHSIPADLGPDAGAAACARDLRGIGAFDLVLLGLGEDGHTAALFPNQPAGMTVGAPDALGVTHAPKRPAERVTLSARRLADTRACLVLVTGKSKAAAMRQLQQGAQIPLAAVRPPAGMDVYLTRDAQPAG
jgi:6-phosphogluconolactonase